MAAAGGTDDLALVEAQLAAVRPLFRPAVRLDRRVLERWADYDARIGIVERRPTWTRRSTSRWPAADHVRRGYASPKSRSMNVRSMPTAQAAMSAR